MGYFLPVLIAPLFYFAFASFWDFGFFCLGVVLGIFLLWFDFIQGYKHYAEPGKPVQLITRSPLFLMTYIPMSLFVITSSGSNLGVGIILSIGFILVYEYWQRRLHLDLLNSWFYAHSLKPLSLTEFRYIFGAFAAYILFSAVLFYV